MKKNSYTDIMGHWLSGFLGKKYSSDYNIDVIKPISVISKLSVSKIKKIDGFSSFEFKPDILGIMENKKSEKVELIFLNRSVNAISLKEIGEMHCYCKLANPIHAFISSPNGVPEEVNMILLNKAIENKLLQYDSKKIIIFKWELETNNINPISIFPIEERRFLLE